MGSAARNPSPAHQIQQAIRNLTQKRTHQAYYRLILSSNGRRHSPTAIAFCRGRWARIHRTIRSAFVCVGWRCRAGTAQHVECQFTEGGEVLWLVIAAVAGTILVETGIEHPVQSVLDLPVGSDHFGETLGPGGGRTKHSSVWWWSCARPGVIRGVRMPWRASEAAMPLPSSGRLRRRNGTRIGARPAGALAGSAQDEAEELPLSKILDTISYICDKGNYHI